MKNVFRLLTCIVLLNACTPHPEHVADTTIPAPIYPDYTDITLPPNIAPLNFLLRNDADAVQVTVKSRTDSLTVNCRGNRVRFPEKRWKSFLRNVKGETLQVTVFARTDGQWLRHPSFRWSVAKEPIDGYLSYRLIEPGYEVWNKVELRERNLTNFEEKVIATHRNTDNACMNCHIYGNKSGELSMFHLRGAKGGTILNRNGKLRKLTLKNDKMVSGAVYGDFHPSGRFGVFSTNLIIPAFHSQGSQRLEVYDTASDLVIADFDTNRLIISPLVSRKDVLETFPTFSPDGKTVYYCSADTVSLPQDIRSLKYSLCSIDFDAETQTWGERIDTLWDARQTNASVCHPKVSPDGRYLLYTVADYGTFPIWHRETELQMMNLQTGCIDSLSAVRAEGSETYHSWSSNSRWFVFAGKRGDGQYGKPYFCYVTPDGQVHKPFVLPQKHPEHYDLTLKSYNLPDLSATPLPFNAETIGNIYKNREAETFR